MLLYRIWCNKSFISYVYINIITNGQDSIIIRSNFFLLQTLKIFYHFIVIINIIDLFNFKPFIPFQDNKIIK